jgi:hypothetical protein
MMSPRGVRSARIISDALFGTRWDRLTALVVERSKVVEELESTHDGLGCRGVHVVKVDQIVDTQLLQFENDRGKVAPENLRVRLLLKLMQGWASVPVDVEKRTGTDFLDEIALRVEPEALSRTGPSSSSCPLLCRCLTDRADQQTLDSYPGVVDLLLGESGVDDVDYPVNRETRLGDVGGDDDLATGGTIGYTRSGGLVEDLLLLLGREGGVEGNGTEGSN